MDMSLWAVALLIIFGFTATCALIPLSRRWAPK